MITYEIFQGDMLPWNLQPNSQTREWYHLHKLNLWLFNSQCQICWFKILEFHGSTFGGYNFHGRILEVTCVNFLFLYVTFFFFHGYKFLFIWLEVQLLKVTCYHEICNPQSKSHNNTICTSLVSWLNVCNPQYRVIVQVVLHYL